MKKALEAVLAIFWGDAGDADVSKRGPPGRDGNSMKQQHHGKLGKADTRKDKGFESNLGVCYRSSIK